MEIMSLKEIIEQNTENGTKFYAISKNGIKYDASFSNKYFGGVMFFCCPQETEIIGYIKRS